MNERKRKATSRPDPAEFKSVSEPAPEAKSEIVSLCADCILTYPRCGGDRAPGFTTQEGFITGCSMYQSKEPAKAEIVPGPEPTRAYALKPMPERLRLKRRIQADNAARAG